MTAAVLVTGSRGLVGAAVVDALSAAGQHPLGLDLASAGAFGQLADLPELGAIVQCAAQIPAAHVGPAAKACVETNRRIDATVVRLAQAREVPLVHLSSMSVYTPGGAVPLDEDTATEPRGPYAESKLDSEALVMRELSPGLVLRLPSPYGPGMRPITVMPRFLTMARVHRLVTFHGAGTREQDFVHVADVAAAGMAAIRHRPRAVLNLCSGRRPEPHL